MIALPQLSPSIPATYKLPGRQAISAPLAIALLELGMVNDEDIHPHGALLTDVFAVPDERALVERSLGRWWARETRDLVLFRWSLHVQMLDYYTGTDGHPWFCVMNAGDIPHLTLALRVEQLEAECSGFGETVLAVLANAFAYLPEAFTPWKIVSLAEYFYWDCEADENEWAENFYEENGYKSKEELLADTNVFKRSDLFQDMPTWLAEPRRLCSRIELERAASSTLAKQVIEACDAITAVVTAPTFDLTPDRIGVHSTENESIDGCVLLRWSKNDATVRVVDDVVNDIYNSGCGVEFLSATQFAPTAKDLQAYLRDTSNMLKMASAVDRLLRLITQPRFEGAERVQINC